MEKRIKNYLMEIDSLLQNQRSSEEWEKQLERHLTQISFFQHERLIHLIVTVVFALLEMLTFLTLLFSFSISLMALTILIMVLLLPYIRHYYILENGVQKMYRQYDEMLKNIYDIGGIK